MQAQEDQEVFHDCVAEPEENPEQLYFYDALDEEVDDKPHKAFHLCIEYETIGAREQCRQVYFVRNKMQNYRSHNG